MIPHIVDTWDAQDLPDVDQLVAAWDRHHPDPTDDPDQRHLLNEIVHPETTAAFRRMVERAGDSDPDPDEALRRARTTPRR